MESREKFWPGPKPLGGMMAIDSGSRKFRRSTNLQAAAMVSGFSNWSTPGSSGLVWVTSMNKFRNAYNIFVECRRHWCSIWVVVPADSILHLLLPSRSRTISRTPFYLTRTYLRRRTISLPADFPRTSRSCPCERNDESFLYITPGPRRLSEALKGPWGNSSDCLWRWCLFPDGHNFGAVHDDVWCNICVRRESFLYRFDTIGRYSRVSFLYEEISQAVSVTTHFTRIFATVIFFGIVLLLARMAPITPVELTAHGVNDVEMMIVVKQVDTFGFVRSFPNNFIQMFFGHDAKLVVRDHLLKGLYLV